MSNDMPNLQRIPLKDILVHDRLRDVNMAEVEKLKLSIEDQGLQAPVVIRPSKVVDPKDKTKFLPQNVEGYILVSGGHRYHAVRDLGWIDIPAIIVEPATPLEARLLEIDENLYRHELNALDRAVFLAERKAIYEEMHPETKHGAQGGRGGNQNETDTVSFSKNTAEKIGLNERTIRRAVSIYDGLSENSRSRIKGTWLALKQGELLHLCACDYDTQAKYLDLMLREEEPLQSVSKCKAHLIGKPVNNSDLKAKAKRKLDLAWKAAPKEVRAAFLTDLAGQGFVILPSETKEAAE